MKDSLFNLVSSQLDKLSGLAEDGPEIANDLKKQLRAIVESSISKLDLVSREEFDAQQQVLLRTREKLEAAEKQLNELEAKINK